MAGSETTRRGGIRPSDGASRPYNSERDGGSPRHPLSGQGAPRRPTVERELDPPSESDDLGVGVNSPDGWFCARRTWLEGGVLPGMCDSVKRSQF